MYKYQNQLFCLCTVATSRMLMCSTEIQVDDIQKNGNLEYSVT